MQNGPAHPTVILISANVEWKALLGLFPQADLRPSPYGEWFKTMMADHTDPFIFFHGGWGKISAAASTQYVMDRWQPGLLVNLGTCGGFEGCIAPGEILLVDRTIVYDIIEQIGDFDQAISDYSTLLDVSWLREPYPLPVRKTLLVSGDRDLLVEDIPLLKSRYGAVAGDWESGAIAWVARRNGVRCLILRGVSDVVGTGGDPAYGNLDFFVEDAREILGRLVATLPAWVACSQS